MNIAGVVAEYNPFHNGHRLHLERTKQQTGCESAVVVMSGNFVQRGEPALADKHARTRMALLNGADVVIELPVMYATASAAYFAKAAVSLLNAAGIVEHLSFGSESGDLNALLALSKATLQQDFQNDLKRALDKGVSFPSAMDAAYQKRGGSALSSPNDILAVAYLNALAALHSRIRPHAVAREQAGYHDTGLHPGQSVASATAIRKAVSENRLADARSAMPESAFDIFRKALESGPGPTFLNHYSQFFHYTIKSHDRQWLSGIQDVSEGLHNRMLDAAGKAFPLMEIIPYVKTKRYTFTKISRAVLHTVLGLTQADLELHETHGGPAYIRILGFRKQSEHLLGRMEAKAALPVITNLKNAKAKLDTRGMAMLQKELDATDIYYLGCQNAAKTPMPKHAEMSMPLVIV